MRVNPLLVAPAASKADRQLISHLRDSVLFREYRDAFESTTDLPLVLRDPSAFNIPMESSRKANPFCVLLATKNRTCSACLELQQKVEESSSEVATTLECFAGLSESSVPIRVGNRVLGFLQTGQVLLHAPNKIQFLKTAVLVGKTNPEVDLVLLEKAYFNSRRVTHEHYQSAVRLVAVFAQHLSAVSNQLAVQGASAESPLIARAKSYISEHQSEDLSLRVVAAALHVSTFYFCKLFKKATGLTFTDYLARVRIESVKQLLLNPHTRISEAAFEAGFQSLSQFNRVFQRVESKSPSEYRESLHGGS